MVGDAAVLGHALNVPIESIGCAGEPNVRDVPTFVARDTREHSGIATVECIKTSHGEFGEVPLHPNTAEREPLTAEVIKCAPVAGLDRLRVAACHAPRATLIIRVRCIVRLSDVGALANGHEPLEIHGQHLPPDSQFRRAATKRLGDPDEYLLEIELVLVRWSGNRLPRCVLVLELRKDLNVCGDSQVRMQFHSAENPLATLTRRDAKKSGVNHLQAVTNNHAKREKSPSEVQRDVL